MIPTNLRNLAEKQRGAVFRSDRAPVLQALSDLGVSAESEFGEFYLNYVTVNFDSNEPCSELRDISIPSSEITEMTKFVQDIWGLPKQYICITSMEGEGCFLYDRITGKVRS